MIFSLTSGGQSSTGFNPSYLMVSFPLSKKARMVDFPTPVSPMKMTASLQEGSLGIRLNPSLTRALILSRLRGVLYIFE